MTILGTNAGAFQGFAGIGLANPAFRLDVQNNLSVRPQTINEGNWISDNTLGAPFRIMHAWSDNQSIYIGDLA